ncbi:aldehyde dehydrogenase family protein [Nocardia sp. NPDC059691]|uniref:aldehyde dehydrogenase family protein n=1 Tax=Nocardia sp. NPDC059691 TaxID=3346908 RepID=UPI0036D11235
MDSSVEATVSTALAALRRGENVWATTTLSERRGLLEQIHTSTAAYAREWVEIAADIKGLPAGSPLVGEEWSTGPYPLMTGTAALAESVRKLEEERSPLDGCRFLPAPGGRTAVEVLPHDRFDRLVLNGFRAQVWSKPGVDAASMRARAGLGQRFPEQTNGIAVVLGAGNIFSIAPLDALYQMYAGNRVVVIKLNPIADPLLPVLEKIFAPAIDQDFMRILTGGPRIGAELTQHPAVAAVHITGSAATHDTIVFGAGQDGAIRKANATPLLTKPITSELGGVSPTVVLPGKWSTSDLRYQAEHVATHRLHNNGYNCIAAQVAIISANWPQKRQFLDELRRAIQRTPARVDYYPGAADRVARALSEYRHAEVIGPHTDRILIEHLQPTRTEPALCTEYFAPVLGILELPGTEEEFLSQAVRVCNDELEGTLGINVVAHPHSIKVLGAAFDVAVAQLRYGTIAINAWTGIGYLTARATWGAFPGHTLADIQSGIGVVHNALLIDEPERTVLRGPFRPAPRSVLHGELTLTPKPPWFVTNRTATTTLERLTNFAKRPRWTTVSGVLSSALRG